MPNQPVNHDTFVIERTYPVSAERIFAAFADPAQKRRWFAEGENHDIEQFEMDFRPGGLEHATYRFKAGTPFPGLQMSNEGTYLDIIPNRRIVTVSTMAFAGNRISASLVTVELFPTPQGTKLICTHQGAFFEGADGPRIREAGWLKLFGNLERELCNDESPAS